MLKPAKGKSNRQPLKRQFHSPLSPEQCRTRLEEFRTTWRTVDDATSMFALSERRAIRRYITTLGAPAPSLDGVLHRQADDTTAVELEAGQNIYEFSYRLNYFFIISSLIFSCVITTYFMGDPATIIAALLVSGLVGFPLLYRGTRSREPERKRLLQEIHDLLDGD